MNDQRPLAGSAVFVTSAQQITADFGGEAVILHTTQGTYYSLNSVGAFVWQRLAQPISLAQLCEAVAAEYEIDPAQIEADLQVLLKDLSSQGLIEAGGTI